MTEPELTFITVNYKTPELVDRLIASIGRFPPPTTHEIVVVDNASGDSSSDLIPSRHPHARFIQLERNIGFGAGNNRGAEGASGRVLVLINSDCEIDRESFGEPIRYLDENPDVGIVGLKVVTPEGKLEQSARGFPGASTGLFGRSTFLGKLAQKFGRTGTKGVAGRNLMVDPEKTEPYDVDWVSGTIMLIRRECWDAVGGFDEGFFMYWEDADLCYRAKQAGWRTVYFPGSCVIHRPGSSASRDPVPAIRWFHQSAYRYVTKHVSPGPSFTRAFAWCALNLRSAMLVARARRKRAGD
jgi:N-acetylglucosaminyl-diphospho-decaprenol L-rhamnosyltransferase